MHLTPTQDLFDPSAFPLCPYAFCETMSRVKLTQASARIVTPADWVSL